ncbi:Sister chromatid cohesion 1 protein 3 [Apostasia shenzhenica]|uniref:Sister chromatid cohesion 1 protein 3 n=1 Tax=Apostasia shenzhenica TaxID=1088818 RepID=A0A2I0AGN2_9ASPA|nr:Sister chromatid cohesion 1 protein 3 [Apostasia shenzhenica]
MFYSQFILAKKGPLGTIWIAAHLERKLRKNQVADTDIGVSVDSILSPDIPIALRLSSHLLLGVVRIYSKKVNYLFHDCSEALLKIKQAFRSTVVDLPPEESTAPYHSITLPETFDLDNFELPDSALLSSNSVDHHVSTKEQITLQDTVNGTSYPTSKFGLDERFGDGDASQISLEFDEELLLEKHFSPLPTSVSMGSKEGGVHQDEASLPSTSRRVHGHLRYDEEKGSAFPTDLSDVLDDKHNSRGFPSVENLRRNEESSYPHNYTIQTPDLNESYLPDCHATPYAHLAFTPEEIQNLIEPDHAPSTPGLLEEVIPSSFHEIPALSPQERTMTSVEHGRLGISVSPAMEIELSEAGHTIGITNDAALNQSLLETAGALPVCKSVLIEPRSDFPVLSSSDGNLFSGTENRLHGSNGTANQTHNNGEAIHPPNFSHESFNLDSHPVPATSSETNPLYSNVTTYNVDVSGAMEDIRKKSKSISESVEISDRVNPSHVEDIDSCVTCHTSALEFGFHLRPCSSNLQQPNPLQKDGVLIEAFELPHRDDCSSLETPVRGEAPHVCGSSVEVQGEDSRSTNDKDTYLEEQHTACISAANQLDELSGRVHSKVTQQDNVNFFSSSPFPEPEKMLAPSCIVDPPNNREQQTVYKGVAESEGSVDRISNRSGKKRRIMDSTAVPQNGNSAKLSGIPRSRRHSDFIPNDDDVLASILVGRKAASVKAGLIPTLSIASSHKRPRTGAKVGRPRKKALVDDAMVLHADAIRQQLINTEDIRRMRKKVPCTRPEIWRIHLCAMEFEMFNRSILYGISAELDSLHDQKCNARKFPSSQAMEQSSHEDGTHFNVQKQVEERPVPPQGGPLNGDQTLAMLEIEADAQGAANARTEETGVSENNRTIADVVKSDGETINLVNQSLHDEAEKPVIAFVESVNSADDTLENVYADTVVPVMNLGTFLDTEGACKEQVVASIRDTETTQNVSAVEVLECTRTLPADDDKNHGATESMHPNPMAFADDLENTNEEKIFGESLITETSVEVVSKHPFSNVIDNVTSTAEEAFVLQQFNHDVGLEVDGLTIDNAAARDSSEFCSAIDDNYTGFLNVDDEEVFDEGENEEPESEAAQSLENNGWSVRSRGVARYLKILFDEESGHGIKDVSVDRLLAGKTRKEASRMFFETLVLKTRDYIQVEQELAYECISIKPRAKLLKSEL